MTIPQDQSHSFGGDLAWLVMEFHLFVSENRVDPIKCPCNGETDEKHIGT
jgi:hypothetical protein